MDTEERIATLEQAVAHLADAVEKALAAAFEMAADSQKREAELAGVVGVGLAAVANDCGADAKALISALEQKLKDRRKGGAAPHMLAPSESLLATLRKNTSDHEAPN